MAKHESAFTTHLDGRPIAGTPTPAPCPFCGSVELVSMEDHSADGCGFNAICDACDARGPAGESAAAAAARWNATASRSKERGRHGTQAP